MTVKNSIKNAVNSPFFVLWVFIAIIILMVTSNIIYQAATGFTKQITIKTTYTLVRRGNMKYMLTDTNGDLYQVGNLWWKWDFNNADDWANLQIGKTYTVKGYGKRVRELSWYPILYDFKM